MLVRIKFNVRGRTQEFENLSSVSVTGVWSTQVKNNLYAGNVTADSLSSLRDTWALYNSAQGLLPLVKNI